MKNPLYFLKNDDILPSITRLAKLLSMHENDVECVIYCMLECGEQGDVLVIIAAASDVAISKTHLEVGLEQAIIHHISNSSQFCGVCGAQCEYHVVDNGIGTYEFWGDKGVDVKVEIESICCGAGVFTNPALNPDVKNINLS